MGKVFTLKDLQEMLRAGKGPLAVPEDAVMTRSAWEFLRDLEGTGNSGKAPGASTDSPAAVPGKVSSASSIQDLEAFFDSPRLGELKEQICDVGRRLWQRAYVDANAGNITIRLAGDLVLCTPTLVSKGFMNPSDMCLVDLEGNQLAGRRKRTSEILMHLEIMKRQPRALACVHCHPPYGTAFAIAGVQPPACMTAEFEVLTSLAIAPYHTPGTLELAKRVAELADHHNTILMANHGVVSWSHLGVEDAYFKMEILENYCRTVLIASQLGKPPQPLGADRLQDLLKIKQSLGIPDPRYRPERDNPSGY